jgi:rhamnosyltransferase
VTLHPRPYASIVIPTRNGMPLVKQCLAQVLCQETAWPFEVVVIDSASTDGTWEFLETLPIKRLRIRPQEFNHGATRNLGAEKALGEVLVFLVQDAVPADRHWLANLVAACDQPNVAGAYSSQLPRPDSTPITRYLALGTTPTGDRPERKALPPGQHLADLPPPRQFQLALFQNASSCIRRSVWLEHQFPVVPYGEDMEWGKQIIDAGYVITYEPAAAVYHSHDRSAYYALKRSYADHYQAADLFGWVMLPSWLGAFRAMILQTARAMPHVLGYSPTVRDKIRFGTLTPLFVSCVVLGQFLGPRLLRYISQYRWLALLDRQLRKGV